MAGAVALATIAAHATWFGGINIHHEVAYVVLSEQALGALGPGAGSSSFQVLFSSFYSWSMDGREIQLGTRNTKIIVKKSITLAMVGKFSTSERVLGTNNRWLVKALRISPEHAPHTSAGRSTPLKMPSPD
jgi:hypothetical protein